MAPPPWLLELERLLGEDAEEDGLARALVVLASVAGDRVAIDEAARRAAARRSLLLLSAGGDPSRGLDLNGRAVSAVAEDLRDVDRQIELEAALRELSTLATGLPHVTEALRALAAAPDIAWRAFACAVLAEELGDDDD